MPVPPHQLCDGWQKALRCAPSSARQSRDSTARASIVARSPRLREVWAGAAYGRCRGLSHSEDATHTGRGRSSCSRIGGARDKEHALVRSGTKVQMAMPAAGDCNGLLEESLSTFGNGKIFSRSAVWTSVLKPLGCPSYLTSLHPRIFAPQAHHNHLSRVGDESQ